MQHLDWSCFINDLNTNIEDKFLKFTGNTKLYE